MRKWIKYIVVIVLLIFIVNITIENVQDNAVKKTKFEKTNHIYDGYGRFDPSEPGIVVLCYHRINDSNYINDKIEKYNYNSQLHAFNVNVDDFEYQMRYLRENNIPIISTQQMVDIVKKGEINKKYVVVTFDDIDKTMYTNAFPILKKYQIPFTSFVIGHDVNEYIDGSYMANWNEVKELYDNPLCTIGSHTYDAHWQKKGKPLLLSITLKDFKEDFKENQTIFADHGMKKPRFFASPYGAIQPKLTDWMMSKEKVEAVFSLENDILREKSQLKNVPRIVVTPKSFDNLKRWLNGK